jgi:multidrug efflux pump subunit AcrB
MLSIITNHSIKCLVIYDEVCNINTPQDASLDKTDEVARFVESIVCSSEALKHCATNVGHGNPRIYYNVTSKERDQTHAQLFIELEKYDPKTMPVLLKELREKFSNYPDASIEVKELEQGPPVDAPVAIRIMGEDLDVLRDVSMDVEEIISSTSGTINLDNPLRTSKVDLRVKIYREKSGLMGVQLIDIDRTIRTVMVGMTASKFRDNKGDEYDIVIRLPVSNKTPVSDLDKIYLTLLITGYTFSFTAFIGLTSLVGIVVNNS